MKTDNYKDSNDECLSLKTCQTRFVKETIKKAKKSTDNAKKSTDKAKRTLVWLESLCDHNEWQPC